MGVSVRHSFNNFEAPKICPPAPLRWVVELKVYGVTQLSSHNDHLFCAEDAALMFCCLVVQRSTDVLFLLCCAEDALMLCAVV